MTLQTRTDRHVPIDEPAEQQVLVALLIDRDAIFKIADVLATDDFYVARHQRIYGAIYELLQRRERIDTLTVQVELARREELDRVGGAAYLADLVARVATAMEIERHAHVVRDKAILRRLLGAATQIAADAYSEPTDMPITLDKAEQRLFALRDDTANTQLRHIQTALQDNFQHLSDRMDRPYEVSGIPSGFRELDFYTEGFTQGDLVVLVVDYIQLMRTGEDEENRVQEISTITRNLKSLARELNVVVIGLSQLSRAAGDSGLEPKLSTLRESGGLEQDSDIVLMLWR